MGEVVVESAVGDGMLAARGIIRAVVADFYDGVGVVSVGLW